MATKIQVRRGNATAIPPLDVAEPGWDVDTKTLRVGDGTSNPTRIPSTKSTGSFDFSSVTDFRIPRVVLGLGQATAVSLYFHPSDPDSGIYSPGTRQIAIATGGANRVVVSDTGLVITGNVTVSGTVDTVDISQLNPTNVNGLMVKTGNNAYAFRSLVPGAGIGPMLNGSGSANAGGANGDIVIAIANNPTIPGAGAMRVPVGSTGDRTQVAAADGHFRYNTTTKAFEGRIDGEWRSLVDYVEGKTLTVPTQVPSIQDAINYYSNRSARSIVNIKLEDGTHTVAAILSPGSITTRINITGNAPTHIDLAASNPIQSVSGTPGNWLVTYKLNAATPSWLTTNHSVMIKDLYGSGDVVNYSYSSNLMASIDTSNKSLVKFRADIGNVADYYQVGDYIQVGAYEHRPTIRRVTSIVNATTLQVDSDFPESNYGSYVVHRRFKRLTGTLSASGSTTVTGTSTSFQTEVNVGDILCFNASNSLQTVKVVAVNSNTSITVDKAVDLSAEIALQYTITDTHQGTWKVSSIDTIANTVTLINTSQDTTPPIRYGIRSGKLSFIPAAILYTSDKLLNLDSNEFVRFTNVTIRYTGTTPTTVEYAVTGTNGAIISCDGYVGFSGAGIALYQSSTLGFNTLLISGRKGTDGNALYVNEVSSATGNWLVLSGNVGSGMVAQKNCSVYSTVFFSVSNGGHGVTCFGGTVSNIFSRTNFNLYKGLWLHRGGQYYTFVADSMNNGTEGIEAYMGSSIFVNWGNSIVAGNAGDYQIRVNAGSQGALRQVVVGAAPKYGIYVNANSYCALNGAITDSCAEDGVFANSSSYITIGSNCQIRAAKNAIQAQSNSHIYVQRSYVKTRSTTFNDLYSNLMSLIIAVECTGYTRTSPAIDSTGGNRGSLIVSST